VSGWVETDVRIGDVWAWGETRIQVCQPRWPCFKLALASGRPVVGKGDARTRMDRLVFSGPRDGNASVDGPIEVIERGDPGVTVYDTHAAMLPETPPRISRACDRGARARVAMASVVAAISGQSRLDRRGNDDGHRGRALWRLLARWSRRVLRPHA